MTEAGLPIERACTECREVKPLEEFYPRKAGKYGRTPNCKVCFRAKVKAWREKNPEKVKAAGDSWRRANPEKVRAFNKKWREGHSDSIRAKDRRWIAANRDKARAYTARYRAKNPEKAKPTPEYLRAWRAANRAKVVLYYHNRRSREIAADFGDADGNFLMALKAEFGGMCAYCLERPSTDIDHYIPLALGGLHGRDNLVPACRTCNRAKWAKHPEDWLYTTQENTCPATQ